LNLNKINIDCNKHSKYNIRFKEGINKYNSKININKINKISTRDDI
jgi:hypothetical protein